MLDNLLFLIFLANDSLLILCDLRSYSASFILFSLYEDLSPVLSSYSLPFSARRHMNTLAVWRLIAMDMKEHLLSKTSETHN